MMMGSMHVLGMFLCVIILGLLIYLVFHLVDKFSNNKRETTEDFSMQILRERFAKGDITEEEFEQKKHTLQKK